MMPKIVIVLVILGTLLQPANTVSPHSPNKKSNTQSYVVRATNQQSAMQEASKLAFKQGYQIYSFRKSKKLSRGWYVIEMECFCSKD